MVVKMFSINRFKTITISLILLLLPIFGWSAQPEKLQKLTVILDWFPNPDHAPLIIAKQLNYFKEQGLDVDLIGPADPSDPPKWIAAQKADIGVTYQPQFMEQVDQGLPLISFGTLIDKPLNCLVALKETKINTLADLKGKKIGSSNGGLTSVMLKVLLASEGLTEKDVQLINVRYNLTQALLSHKIDAVTGMMRNFEVPQLELNNQQVTVFFPEEHGIPTYNELIFITHIKNIHDDRLPKFLAALRKAVMYIDQHPKLAWQSFAKQYPESNNEVNKQAWFATLPYFAENPGNLNEKEWENFANFMQKNKLIKKSLPVSQYLVVLETQTLR